MLQLREVDKTTREWIRNASDEAAARNGCRFLPELGERVIKWWRENLRLYEGAWAGKPFEAKDWQYECTMRMYSWVRFSQRWSDMLGRDMWIRRFRYAVIFVPKKNKKSPTLAAHALYLLCGDGEKGQKVFLAARDGAQAKDIAGKHTVEMVRSSPRLSQECVIQASNAIIHHLPTASMLKPIASADARSQESKEGINGSVLVDEVHVVDQRFMRRVSRAGISRMQPFQIEVSTAGNNPDGYGHARWEYGHKVARGDLQDQTLFFASYEAPQDVSDDALDADPVKYGQLANPAWGHTIDQEEYLADYQQSKQSISDLADFKMYRLNVWQHSVNPWLRGSQWDKCGADYRLDDLVGGRWYLGLDLSKTEDMTAAVIATHRDGLIWLYPFFWLPEATARRNNHLAPFLQWAHDGHVELTPGDVVDYAQVEAKLGELIEAFGIDALVYDKWHAEELTQRLVNSHGIERLEFAQSITNYAKPTAEFERRVIAGTLRHPRHPVLSWQAGHANVRTDTNGNKRPVKPGKDDFRKIDGIAAGIMALSKAMEETQTSVYATRGVILI